MFYYFFLEPCLSSHPSSSWKPIWRYSFGSYCSRFCPGNYLFEGLIIRCYIFVILMCYFFVRHQPPLGQDSHQHLQSSLWGPTLLLQKQWRTMVSHLSVPPLWFHVQAHGFLVDLFLVLLRYQLLGTVHLDFQPSQGYVLLLFDLTFLCSLFFLFYFFFGDKLQLIFSVFSPLGCLNWRDQLFVGPKCQYPVLMLISHPWVVPLPHMHLHRLLHRLLQAIFLMIFQTGYVCYLKFSIYYCAALLLFVLFFSCMCLYFYTTV